MPISSEDRAQSRFVIGSHGLVPFRRDRLQRQGEEQARNVNIRYAQLTLGYRDCKHAPEADKATDFCWVQILQCASSFVVLTLIVRRVIATVRD